MPSTKSPISNKALHWVKRIGLAFGAVWMIAVGGWVLTGGLGNASPPLTPIKGEQEISVKTEETTSKHQKPFTFIALGDMPYNGKPDEKRFEALIEHVNTLNPSFVVHVGDIKSGGTPCSDEKLTSIAQTFRRFKAPLVYTPGDNEWTDCHTRSSGQYKPLERLDKLRELFWLNDNPYEKTLPVTRQANYPENVRWAQQGILFTTLNMPGSNNNRRAGLDAFFSPNDEYKVRNKANLQWLHQAFEEAKQTNTNVIVVMTQADPGFEAVKPLRTGFNNFIDTLTNEVKHYSGNVLLVHGDSHRFRIDTPIRYHDPNHTDGRLETKFQRLIVFGDSDVHAVQVTINPIESNPFRYQPLLTTK